VSDVGNVLDTPYGGDIIADHLIDQYDIIPFLQGNGNYGLHFMNLSSSIEMEISPLSEIKKYISCGFTVEELAGIREILLKCIVEIDVAIAKDLI
jgi:hypothetical protein